MFIVFLFLCISSAEQNSYTQFQLATRHYSLTPDIITLIDEKPKSLVFYSVNESWNNHHFKFYNKINTIKEIKELSLIDGVFIHSLRYKPKRSSSNTNYYDLQIPLMIKIEDYKEYYLKKNRYYIFRDKVIKSITKMRDMSSGAGRAITLVSKEIAGSEVSLKIDGNININGQLIFEDKELVGINKKQNKSWDLDIEQTQRFNIEGTIGDRVSIKAHQDSEADFSFENDLNISYKGKKNDILKKVEAGNIGLQLPSSQLVSVGSGSSEGLFGIKMVQQLGPLAIQSIISREQVKKSSKSSSLESSEGNYINAYNYIKDRYYFIDEYFKVQYYPLDDLNKHTFTPFYTIIEHEIWKMIDPQNETIQGDKVQGTARVNPLSNNSNTDYEAATWVKLKEDLPNDNEVGDYEIDRLLGTIRFNNIKSEDIIGISYKIGKYVPLETGGYEYLEFDGENDPNLQEVIGYFNKMDNELTEQILLNNGTSLKSDCEDDDCNITLKLIKSTNKVSDPSSPTWDLMFKNVYSMGSSDISIDGLEFDIIYIGGNLDEQTHSEISNTSFLKIFGLDRFDQNGNTGSDGKIDNLNSNILNSYRGELMFPTYLPFAFDPNGRLNNSDEIIFGDSLTFWGTQWNTSDSLYYEDLNEYLPSLDDTDNNFIDGDDDGPAMYYELLGSTEIMSEHKFQLRVKHSKSQRSSTYSLGFMIVEGSEEVRLNGTKLTKGVDYTIDYFSGTLNIINQMALDPTANIDISYEENELVSFDQKLLAGVHMKLDFSDNDYLSGGAYYYNQSIVDSKVEIGYEPMRNFLWNIGGKYDRDLDFLTKLTDMIPFVEADKKSSLNIEGEFAKVYPNPNPLGQAFLDDFEASKRTSAPSILQNKWKLSSTPLLYQVDSFDCPPNLQNCNDIDEWANRHLDITNRDFLFWYNPYDDWLTSSIWPNIQTSNRAQNTTTKTLWLGTNENWDEDSWAGITTALYPSDYNQERSKYIDVWLYTEDIQDPNMELNIDIGYISEDMNGDNILNSEDQAIFGNIGNNILDEGEDVGYDGCTDLYEDGNGACLSANEGTFTDLCNSINDQNILSDWRYFVQIGQIPNINYDLCSELNLDSNGNHIDPNQDNFIYNEGTDNYENINGSEGNGDVQGYVYPDTEDLDGDYLQDFNNDYFTYTIKPKIDIASDSTQTSTGQQTGWKLFRINLSDFGRILPLESSNVEWSDVRMMRLWVQGQGENLLGLAKIEIVGSQWEEVGETNIDSLDFEDSYQINPEFSISVINSDENSDYSSPEGVEGEYDEYNQITLKEQSLVMDFDDSGISPGNAVNIKKVLTYMSNDNKDNFFAYEKLKMFVNGQPSYGNDWSIDSTNLVNLIFRMGKEDEYYELRQPIYEDWDERNHIDIDIDLLTKKKLDIVSFDVFYDYGVDSVQSKFENGCGGRIQGGLTYVDVLEIISNNSDLSCTDTEDELYNDECNELFENVWGDEGVGGIITSGIFDYNSEFFPDDLDSLTTICGPGSNGWSIYQSIFDPNGDDLSEMNQGGLENNQRYDFGEIFEDSNQDGIYNSPPENYNEDLDLYTWTENLSDLCGNCSEFLIKGEPAINRIEQIMVGVANETNSEIYGQVFLNELRFTGVKKDKGQAYRLSGKVNFSDLASIESQYKFEEADFHRLQERLGEGSTSETFSINSSFKADKFLPSEWGLSIPLNFNFSTQNSTPKYYPYQPDVLTGSFENAPDEIKSLNKTASFSTSFRKSTRSKNWIIKNSFDKINLNYSIINRENSSVTVLSDISKNQDFGIDYTYDFSNDNFLAPFKSSSFIYNIFTNTPLVKYLTKPIIEKIKDTKIYYTPSKFSAMMDVSENNQLKIMRQGLDSTETNSLDLNRKLTINHKVFDNLQTNYSINVGSDLYHELEVNDLAREDLLLELNPGLIENVSQNFSATYIPELFYWIKPQFKYQPGYTWTLGNPSDEVQTSTIKNTSNFDTRFDITPKDIVEIFYKPDNSSSKKKSSSRRGRRSSSSKNKQRDPIFKNIENPIAKSVFNSVHGFMSKFSKVQFDFNLSETHNHANILADQFIDYNFRLGISDTPSSISYSNQDGKLGSFSHSYSETFKIKVSSISVIPSISLTGLEFKSDNTNSSQSTGIPSSNSSISYYPFPWEVYGKNGLFLPSWGLTWSGLEKIDFIKEKFKSFKFSHNAKGQRSMSYQDNQLLKTDYSLLFSPLIKLTARSKGKNPIDFEVGSKYNLDIFSEGSSVEHDINTQLWGKIEYSRTAGMYIPVPFLRDLDLKNTVSFSFSTDFDFSRKLVGYQQVENISELTLDDSSSKFSLTPKMSYQFSQWVSGNIFFKYILSDDINTGERVERDFGFNLTIQIRG